MKLLTLIITYFLFLSNSFAAPVVGKVVKARGDLSALFPGEKEAKQLKTGMSVMEDTSILSGNASFAQIQMNDGSRLVLGPKSKMVVNFVKKKEGGVISLLKGKVRSEVKKESDGKTKMLVRTRSAAMGVRGTDFQATYNPESNTTSLLTYSGKVAMVKVDKKDAKKLIDLTTKKNKSKESLESVFKNKKPVMVEKGSYSAVTQKLKKATKPVNLNPVQFSVLKLNKDFVTKKSDIPQEKIEKEVESIKKVLKKRAVDTNSTAAAEFDSKTGQYKPKDGGLVDLETGLYIPPAKDSKFDKKLNIFVDKDVEKKISENGDFVPPKGVKLDAKKGFVSEDGDDNETVAELNKEIAAQVVEPKKKPTFDELENDDDAYDKYFDYED